MNRNINLTGSIILMITGFGLIFFASCNSQVQSIDRDLRLIETEAEIQFKYRDNLLLSYAKSTKFPDDTLPVYYARSGFVYPLKTLNGSNVVDGFPKGHTHQHGLFSAWTKTTFRNRSIDFWNQQQGLGNIRHKSLQESIGDSCFSAVLEYLAFLGTDTIVALEEHWTMCIQMKQGYYTLDWTIEQFGNGLDSLVLEQYHYGGTAFRGAALWNVENNYDSICYFETDQGLDHLQGNHSQPRWAAMFGTLDGGAGGAAMIQHKSNLRYPQYIRVHPSMPYFCFLPVVKEPYVIQPDDRITNRFRLVVFDGDLPRATIAAETKYFNEQ